MTLTDQIDQAESRAARYALLAQRLRLELAVKQDVRIKRAPYWRRRYWLSRGAEILEKAGAKMRMRAWEEMANDRPDPVSNDSV